MKEYYGFYKYEWVMLFCIFGGIIIKAIMKYCF